MRTLAWAVAVSFLTAYPISAGTQSTYVDMADSGNNYMTVCESATKEKPEYGTVMRCLGFIQGFSQGVMLQDERSGRPQKDRLYCERDGATFGQTLKIVIKYISDHPEQAHLATRYLIGLALTKGFPCNAK